MYHWESGLWKLSWVLPDCWGHWWRHTVIKRCRHGEHQRNRHQWQHPSVQPGHLHGGHQRGCCSGAVCDHGAYLSLYSFLLGLGKNFSRDLSSFAAAAVFVLFVYLFLAVLGHCSWWGFLELWSVQSTDSGASAVAARQLSSCGPGLWAQPSLCGTQA